MEHLGTIYNIRPALWTVIRDMNVVCLRSLNLLIFIMSNTRSKILSAIIHIVFSCKHKGIKYTVLFSLSDSLAMPFHALSLEFKVGISVSPYSVSLNLITSDHRGFGR